MRLGNTKILCAALGFAAVVTGTAANASVLVVRSLGPSAMKYRPGTMIPDSQPIVLKASDTLTLLDNAKTWKLCGPGSFPASASARSVSCQQVASATNSRRAKIGAVRSVGTGAPQPSNLWMVDIGAPGATCIVDTRSAELWRADATTAGTTKFTDARGKSASVTWRTGQVSQPWPAALPASAGTYTLAGAGVAAGSAITLKTLAAQPASLPDAGRALIAAGCDAQVDLLITQMGGS